MSASAWLLLAIVALFAAGVWIYNRLVADRNLAREGFADIDVQLKRRADLVPQLVEAVRGYAAYEKATLSAVTELRASAAGFGPGPDEARFGAERESKLDILVINVQLSFIVAAWQRSPPSTP